MEPPPTLSSDPSADLEHLHPPPRCGYTFSGTELHAWLRPRPWYSHLMALPLLAFAIYLAIRFSHLSAERQAANTSMVVFIAFLAALWLFLTLSFLFSRHEIRMTPQQVAYRKAMFGLGRWRRMSLPTVHIVAQRSKIVSSGITENVMGERVKAYKENITSLVIAGEQRWEIFHSHRPAVSDFFCQLVTHTRAQFSAR